jgi:RNA polymerase sigma-70 factor (ECF subfamily)
MKFQHREVAMARVRGDLQVRSMASGPPAPAARKFATTRWSIVFKAAEPEGERALSLLCQRYWYPIYAFVRGHGLDAQDAADVTQGFFEKLLARNDIAGLSPDKGQFRSWLRACARNYLCNWFAHRRTLAAGGQAVHVSIDGALAEERLRLEAKEQIGPDRLFDRRWALAVMERALTRLGEQYEQAGKAQVFRCLYETLGGDGRGASDLELASLLGKSAGAVRVERHRMRRRFHECLRAEVAKTISGASRVDDEIRRLIDALA